MRTLEQGNPEYDYVARYRNPSWNYTKLHDKMVEKLMHTYLHPGIGFRFSTNDIDYMVDMLSAIGAIHMGRIHVSISPTDIPAVAVLTVHLTELFTEDEWMKSTWDELTKQYELGALPNIFGLN